MIYDCFRATGACDAPQGLADLSNVPLHEDDIQDFDTRWDQAMLTASEIPTETVLKITGFFSVSDSIGHVRPRNCSKSRIAKLSKIEDHGKTAH